MNADVLTTRVDDGIAVITLGSSKQIYFNAEMGDMLTAELEKFAGAPNIRVVVVTGGAPGYFNRHFSIPALLELAEAVRASAVSGLTTPPIMADSSTELWRSARPCRSP